MPSSRPNLLLIMCDQLRFDALRAAGNDVIQTPNLDRLCAEGVRFAYGYTESPVCVSARAICMTGQLPHRTGIFDNGYALPAGYPTVMSRLRAAGYFTQAIGKMHFSPVREHHGCERMWLSEEVPRRVENDEFCKTCSPPDTATWRNPTASGMSSITFPKFRNCRSACTPRRGRHNEP